MPLKIKSMAVESVGGQQKISIKYDVTHSTPGGDGTTLTQDLVLIKDPLSNDRWEAKLFITECKGETPDEVLTKMVGWLKRLSEGLKQRGDSETIPL